MRQSSARTGHTLVELAFATVLVVVVIALPALLLGPSGRACGTGTSRGHVDLAARRALDKVAALLNASGTAAIPAAAAGPTVPFTAVTFQRANGFTASGPTWGNTERIEMQPEPGEPVDGVDNDGNGLVDEQRVVWISNLGLPAQRTHVLCTAVRRALEGEVPGNGLDDNGNGFDDEGGLLIAFEGERVQLALTIERRDAYGVAVLQTARRTVALRN